MNMIFNTWFLNTTKMQIGNLNAIVFSKWKFSRFCYSREFEWELAKTMEPPKKND